MFDFSDVSSSVVLRDYPLSSILSNAINLGPTAMLNMSSAEQQAALGIDLTSSFYHEGNKFVRGNNQWMGAHPFQCVEFAYGRAMELGLFQDEQEIGAIVDGDAGTWDDDLIGTFYQDRLYPQVGVHSFVVWEGNLNLTNTHPDGSWETFSTGPAGHVGFVEAVYEDGSYLVSEANVNGEPFHLAHITPGSGQYNEAEFICLKDIHIG